MTPREIMLGFLARAADPSSGVWRVSENPAVQKLQRGCDGDDLEECVSLGLRYAGGDGVSKDEPRAVSLYKKACDDGSGDNTCPAARKAVGV